MTTTPITAADILNATATLAATQAADPISEDGCGFNNADFPAGLTLAASGDVLGSAALLFCYPRQATEFGITREALAAFLPETISEKGRSEARLILSDARNNVAGKLAFSKISDNEVLFNGVRLSSDTTKFMKKLGAVRTTTGYVLKTNKINALKGLVGAENILNIASLNEIAAGVEQFTFVAPIAPKKFPFTVKVSGAAPAFYMNWEYASNNATFEAIKEIVKPMSSGFKTGLGWLLTPNQLVMASISLVEADIEGVDVSAVVEHAVCTDPKLLDLRDEIRSGSIKVKILKSDDKTITLVIRKYDSVFVEACKAAQGRYNGEPTKSWTVNLTSLPRIISTLLAFPRFDVSLLDPFILDTIAAPAPVKREGLTHTPSGLPLFPHQIDDLAFLLQDFSLLGTKGGLLANDMGLGKAQPLTATLVTPTGLRTMGEAEVGMDVIGPDGKPTPITGVFPQGVKAIYRVRFSDGTSTECCGEHLWEVQSTNHRARKGQFLVKSTADLLGDITYGNRGNAKWYIPITRPIEFAPQPLPLDPYLLGVLLGDGCIPKGERGSILISSMDLEILNRVEGALPGGLQLKKVKGSSCDYRISRGNIGNPLGGVHPLQSPIRALGLWGTSSFTKFIPPCYLFNSIENRIALLQGLMDTDGYVSGDGALEFTVMSKSLAEGVMLLVQGLGGVVRWRERTVAYHGKTAFRLSLSLPNDIPPFHLKRKAERVIPRTKYVPSRAIESITYLREEEAQCISVAAGHHCYLTDHCIVTHNTISSAVAAHTKCPKGRKLVVVPSVAKENWKREIHKFIGADQTVQIVSGRTDVIGDATWIVINYDVISYYKQALIDAGFAFVIMDEVHMLKNLKAQRTQALVSYWDAKARVMVPGIVDSIPNVLPMSGTPMLNRPNELFSILRALGSPMGKSKSKFEERYCDGKFITVDRTGRQVWSNTGSSNSGELASNVAPFFRKVFKADVLNLPPKVRTSIPVEISKADRKMFDRLFTDLENASATDDNDEPTGEILRLIGILKHETARVKVASTIEQAETIVQAGEKVIIFTCYTDTLEQIAAHFGSKAVVVDGSVTGPKRMTAVDAFQNNPEIRVFVGNVKAAGVAITLTAASYVIFNDRDWTPAMIFQAEDRAYRIGQTEMVNIYHMTAEGTFDEELVSALSGKSTLISGWEQAAIDGSEQAQVEPANIKAALFTYISNRKKSA